MEKANILTIRVPLRLAKAEDFFTEVSVFDFTGAETREKRRHLGMNYFLKNDKGNFEIYTLTQHTNTIHLVAFIASKRCFVLATVSSIDYEAKITEWEGKWIDSNSKQ